MYKIGIVTNGKNFEINQFLECFSKSSYVYYSGNADGYFVQSANVDYQITEYSDNDSVTLNDDIVILCCERINNLKIKNKAMVLVDCTEYLHYSSVPDDCTIISCGAGEKNTVSLSSISDNAIVLNIAREIKRLEIQECVINTEKPIKNIYTALFAYTVLILTNKEEPPCLQDTKAI